MIVILGGNISLLATSCAGFPATLQLGCTNSRALLVNLSLVQKWNSSMFQYNFNCKRIVWFSKRVDRFGKELKLGSKLTQISLVLCGLYSFNIRPEMRKNGRNYFFFETTTLWVNSVSYLTEGRFQQNINWFGKQAHVMLLRLCAVAGLYNCLLLSSFLFCFLPKFSFYCTRNNC